MIPTEATVELDARLLPGQEPDDLLAQLKPLLPNGAEVEVVRAEPPPSGEADLTLLPLLTRILTDADPDGVPFPMLSPGITDARFYTRLGIQTYGFLPMRLPPDISFDLIHATNERVPADAIEFGTLALHELFRRYGPETRARPTHPRPRAPEPSTAPRTRPTVSWVVASRPSRRQGLLPTACPRPAQKHATGCPLPWRTQRKQRFRDSDAAALGRARPPRRRGRVSSAVRNVDARSS